MDCQQYWLVALPLEDRISRGAAGAEQLLKVLNDKTSPDLATNYKFALPELRVGTLDALLALSDDMAKTMTLVEGVTAKIKRQLAELDRPSAELSALSVDGVPVRRFLTQFAWSEAKHPARLPLRETLDKLTASVAQLEDELKVKAAEYSAAKGALGAVTRKTGGSLATRDLHEAVAAAVAGGLKVVESEHLTTLYVAVPAHSQAEWRSGYETLAEHVVPRSTTRLAEEADYALFSCVLFKRAAEAFKHAAREKGYQVREHVHDAAGASAAHAEAGRLTAECAARKANLAEWCRTAFGDAFSALLHALALRLFVEAILRYGLPPAFAAVLVAPDPKQSKRLRGVMGSVFGRTASGHWKQQEDDAAKGEEVFPYVSLTLDLP